ncbi:Uncharacterised protein [Yersinia intermedia]|jgi:hypothetical protein|uniref:hypothetical protein n=1 Tax=Yersinia intermedia TaxID=631 RepID=UPI0005AD0BF7|nr:hypothetical protein [Yersinia intermedia]AJJ19630.1 hypothetical protein CH53_3315 [Yersinia intermedia]MDA5511237.1 phosphodiesterase [Yersinia intermedia]CNH28411.1 Uncharacterised protein [Yersinia intermedia]CNH66261.1 Uncharacterised protein [Yersinia intermedia]CQD75194.1 Uncharacterised protein [Yersinia intermedia]
MKIISHRGYWEDISDKNTKQAFTRSFKLGFGTETDIRDRNGSLVISHDMPRGNEMLVEDFFVLLEDKNLPLALNIKADGLCEILCSQVRVSNITNAFVFDMSVPDLRSYLRNGVVKVFTRLSEYEPVPAFFDDCDGVWLDCFESIWFNETDIINILKAKKIVCIVSPELHGRKNNYELWDLLKKIPSEDGDNLILCTDLPQKALAYFEEHL